MNYWLLIIRDISLVLTSIWYTHRALKDLQLMQKNTEQEEPNTYLDFEMMLVSNLPLRYFTRYLEKEKSDLQPYLRMIYLIRLISEKGQLLEEKRAEHEKL